MLFSLVFGAVASMYSAPVRAQTWVEQDSNLVSIAFGVSFVNSTHGWIPGADASTGQDHFLKSTDGGQTWEECVINPGDDDPLPLGIAMATTKSGAVNGVVGGVGFAGAFTGVMYTLDGNTWQAPEKQFLISTSIAPAAIPDIDGGFGLAGAFTQAVGTDKEDYNGVSITSDGGQTWTSYDIGASSNAEYPAQYAAFPSATTWYVTAGTYPSSNPEAKRSRWENVVSGPKGELRYLSPDQQGKTGLEYKRKQLLQTGQYNAAVYKTSNGGKSWVRSYVDNSHTVAPYAISCPADENNCWFVTFGSGLGSQIISTTNGGTTWTKQWQSTDSSYQLNYVDMFNNTHGTACGAQGGQSLFLLTTDGGNIWQQQKETTVGELCLTLSIVSSPDPSQPYLGWGTSISISGGNALFTTEY